MTRSCLVPIACFPTNRTAPSSSSVPTLSFRQPLLHPSAITSGQLSRLNLAKTHETHLLQFDCRRKSSRRAGGATRAGAATGSRVSFRLCLLPSASAQRHLSHHIPSIYAPCTVLGSQNERPSAQEHKWPAQKKAKSPAPNAPEASPESSRGRQTTRSETAVKARWCCSVTIERAER